jgi:hypothetical protein
LEQEKVTRYIDRELPDSEERIKMRMNPYCEVSVLEEIGKIEYNKNIKTVTAIRYSPRVEKGFGGGMLKCSEDIKNKDTIEVPHPNKASIIKQIQKEIKELLKTGEMTSGKLKEIFKIDDQIFIDDGDLQLLTQELSGISELNIKHLSPAAYSILKKVFLKIEKVDPIDLTEASDLIRDNFMSIIALPGRGSPEFKYIELAAMKEAVLPSF